MTRDAESEFQGWTCHAPDARLARMTEVVLRAVQPGDVRRVLDVGCGTGAQVRHLARHLPNATFTGVDISDRNIRAADQARTGDPHADRMRFVCGDYLDFQDDPFDLVVSDGVLHFIDTAEDPLIGKLARDVTKAGTLVVAMATECLYNQIVAFGRHLFGRVRSPFVDGLILRAARVVHGSRMSDAMLAERIPYLSMPPRRLLGPRLLGRLGERGLRLVMTHEMPATSAAELRHAVVVFRREALATTGAAVL